MYINEAFLSFNIIRLLERIKRRRRKPYGYKTFNDNANSCRAKACEFPRDTDFFQLDAKCYSYQILFQLRFKSWPDRGMPSTPNDLIELGVDQNLILIINTL